MRNLFKPGDRVVHRKTKQAGSVHAVRDAGMFGEGYRVAWDMGVDEKLVRESDLLPENPTYQQCEQELCRMMQLMVDNRKQHLALLEEATVWAKKMTELKVLEGHEATHAAHAALERLNDPITKVVPGSK